LLKKAAIPSLSKNPGTRILFGIDMADLCGQIRLMMRIYSFIVITLSWVAAVPMVSGEPTSAADTLTAKLAPIMAEKKPQDRLTQLSDLGTKLSLAEIPQALAASKGFKQWRERVVLQSATLRHWAELAPADAFAYIGKLPESRTKAQLLNFAADKFTTQNPESAAAATIALPPGASRNGAMEIVGRTWAKTDGKKALAWADNLPEGPAKDTVVRGVLFVWVHIDPVDANTRIETLPEGTYKKMLLTNVAIEWGAIDHEAAFKWAAGLPPDSDAVERIVESWADQDPTAAGQYALLLPPGTARQQAIMGVMRRWVTQDPAEAAHWLMQNADPQTLNQAMTQLMNFWVPEGPQEAERYVENLPNGPSRDTVVHDFVQAVANWAPDLGAKQAMMLADPGMRNQDVVTCLQHWLQTDPPSAQQWLQKTDLPQDVKEKCLLPPETGQPMR
jgi:hypothetical protein